MIRPCWIKNVVYGVANDLGSSDVTSIVKSQFYFQHLCSGNGAVSCGDETQPHMHHGVIGISVRGREGEREREREREREGKYRAVVDDAHAEILLAGFEIRKGDN